MRAFLLLLAASPLALVPIAFLPKAVLLDTAVSAVGIEFKTNRGVPNGYAPLDAAGLVPLANLPPIGGGGLPAGAIVLIISGSCPAGFSEAADLDGFMLRGTVAANGDVGTTAGSDSIIPSGVNSAPTFTGSALAGHSHTFTGSPLAGHGHTFTGSALGAHLHGVGTYAASAHTGSAVADHASHTHTYTQVVNHVHVQNVNSATTGGLSGYTPDTSTNTSVASGYSTANPTGGVAMGTTAGPSAVLTHSVTQPSTHTMSGSSSADSAGTPAGTLNSVSAGTPAGTLDSISGGTPAGTVTAPVFTGSSFDNRPAYTRVIFCRKT